MDTLTTTYPHIEKLDGKPARLKRVPRTRVAMIVMDYLYHGMSVDQMCQAYPYLRPAEAHAAMAYYFDHKAEIDAEIKADEEEYQRSRAAAGESPVMARLRAQGLLPHPTNSEPS